jgi:hypothetical protein
MSDQIHPLASQENETIVLAVGAGGAFAFVLGWMLDSGFLRALGLIAAIAGGGLYARGRLAERQEKIDEDEASIRSELDELDPVARAQVLRGIEQPDS